jgi:hypothetical protein
MPPPWSRSVWPRTSQSVRSAVESTRWKPPPLGVFDRLSVIRTLSSMTQSIITGLLSFMKIPAP